jgi:phage terminase small subunit
VSDTPDIPGLDKLPPKRRAFVLAYLGEAAGNATAAARIAGYKAPTEEGCRLLRFAEVAAIVEAHRRRETARAIMTIEELQSFWAAVARGQIPEDGPASVKDRLKATELLGKSQGAFIERREITGNVVPVVAIQINTSEEQARVMELARKRSEGK